MVEDSLLAREPYRDGAWHEYRLKSAGLATVPAIIMQSGDRHMPHPDGRPLRVVDRETGQAVRAVLVSGRWPAGRGLGHTFRPGLAGSPMSAAAYIYKA